MQINWPIANDAAAGQSNSGFFAAAQQWSKNTNRSSHSSNDIVRRDRLYLFRRDRNGPAGALHLRAQMGKNLQHVFGVTQIGHPMNDTRFPGEQRRRQDWQGRFFRSAALDGTRKRMAAV